MNPLFPIFNLAEASLEEIQQFIVDSQTVASAIAEAAGEGDLSEYVNEARTVAQLMDETAAGVAAIQAARAELATRESAAVEVPVEPEVAEQLAALAAEAGETDDAEPAPEPVPEPEPEAAAAEPETLAVAEPAAPAVEEPTAVAVEPEAAPAAAVEEPVVAAAAPVRPAPPVRGRVAAPAPSVRLQATLTAAASGLGPALGEDVDPLEVAAMMIRRRRDFGVTASGSRERFAIARYDYADEFPEDRRLGGNLEDNMALIASVIDPQAIKAELARRRNGALTASGGLCAPVTPYYGLEMISTSGRPVRDSLPGFNAARGGIRYARPATLAEIDTAVGVITAAEDAAGGSGAVKSCQVVDCPPFQETDVSAFYHCLQTGNMPARTFPELLAQWNGLLLAAQARLADSELLTAIDAFSTQVTAASMGLGATGDLLGQILAAVNGMRNRHRMDPEAVLRIMLPDWAIDLMISDVIRGQFARFDTDEAKLTAFLRTLDVEPTFYIDGAAGKGQVFGVQAAGGLNEFPPTVNWFLFPEGSFLHLDAGTLELGLVRDSVLNATNDFQLFGESFENVAYIGVESLSVVSTVCDNGVVSAPQDTACPAY